MSNAAPILQNYDLSWLNTMALASHASHAIELTEESQIPDAVAANHEAAQTVSQRQKPSSSTNTASIANEAETPSLPVFVLSGGSNVLLPNRLNALVLLPKMRGVQVVSEDKDSVCLEVMAGENWHELVVSCTNQGWYGIENLALIPGLVGAAPVQNIGAYGVQLDDRLTHVKAYHLPSRTWHMLSREQCRFGYRDSLFKQQPNTWLISRVGLQLHKDVSLFSANYGDVHRKASQLAEADQRTQVTPLDVMHAIIDIRQQKLPDPRALANCGSFFQNPVISETQFNKLQAQYPDIVGYPQPQTTNKNSNSAQADKQSNSPANTQNDAQTDAQVKVAAGWLIEQAGLKGHGIAPILTHQKQALVLTNHAPHVATQADIKAAQEFIVAKVADKFAITLVREPVWVEANAGFLPDDSAMAALSPESTSKSISESASQSAPTASANKAAPHSAPYKDSTP